MARFKDACYRKKSAPTLRHAGAFLFNLFAVFAILHPREDLKKIMKRAIIVIGVILATIFVVFVWPTAYRYDRFGITTIRTNRFTENTQFLTVDGWKDAHRHIPSLVPAEAPVTMPAPAPAPEKPLEYLAPSDKNDIRNDEQKADRRERDIFDKIAMDKRSAEKKWKLVSLTNENSLYIDTETISHLSPGIVKVWVKEINHSGSVNYSKIQNYLKELGKDPKSYGYTLVLWELNCSEKKNRMLKWIDYTRGGEQLNIVDIPLNDPHYGKWVSIISGSKSDLIHRSACTK